MAVGVEHSDELLEEDGGFVLDKELVELALFAGLLVVEQEEVAVVGDRQLFLERIRQGFDQVAVELVEV